ncbi:MAG: hypothetical protein RL135_2514, partial [Bacteroidota bacterium]
MLYFYRQPMKKLIFILLLVFNLPAFAQLQRNYTSYTVDNGLAQNTVWDAFQDYKGYMWFGTADGVNRFDGYTMHHYKRDSKDSTTILGNNEYKFYEDSERRLWISHTHGISIYNRKKDCFINVLFDNQAKSSILESYATVLGEDNKGRVWSVSGTNELIAISKDSYLINKRIKIYNGKFLASSFRAVISNKKFIIGYSYDSTLSWFKLDTETDKLSVLPGPKNQIGYFLKYNDSTICNFDKNNIYYYHVNQNRYETRRTKTNGLTNSLNTLVVTNLVWWEGKIYLGNNTGLYVFNPTKLEFEERITSFTKGKKVDFYYVENLRVDKSGNLWICTNGNGVKCLSPYRNKFKHYNSYELRNQLVKSISTDSTNSIYVGLYAEGLVTFNAKGMSEQYKFGKSK